MRDNIGKSDNGGAQRQRYYYFWKLKAVPVIKIDNIAKNIQAKIIINFVL